MRKTPGMAKAALALMAPGEPPSIGHKRTAAYNMPGKRTSIPNMAVPLTLSGTSVRGALCPISVQSLRAFRLTLPGGVETAYLANWP